MFTSVSRVQLLSTPCSIQGQRFYSNILLAVLTSTLLLGATQTSAAFANPSSSSAQVEQVVARDAATSDTVADGKDINITDLESEADLVEEAVPQDELDEEELGAIENQNNIDDAEELDEAIETAEKSLSAAIVSEVTLGAQRDPALLQLQRRQYIAALDALKKKRYKAVDGYIETLATYPLTPYLEYEQLHRRLYLFPYQDVENFLDRHANSNVGDQLDRRWLRTLAEKNHWHDYQTYFASSTIAKNNAEFECYNLVARFKTGEEKALAEVEPLWNVGESQPKACDPIFKAWIAAGYLTPDIAWSRHSKAINSRKRELARYIAKQMPEDLKKLSALYLEIDRYPENIQQHRRFADQSPKMNEIILHGLRRYSRRDPVAAMKQWERYSASHLFDTIERDYTLEYLITQLAKKGFLIEAEQMLTSSEKVSSEELIAWIARDALRQQDWQRVYNAIKLFSPEEQQSERWLYWRARAMTELNIQDPDYPTADQIYNSLALTRSFYGFMAADLVGHEYTLIDRPVNSPADLVGVVANKPSMLRAHEFLQLGNLRDARREWSYATRSLSPNELLAAGKLAEQWGWYRKSIQTMMEARHWDDLQLRFPLAYQTEVETAAKNTNIAPTLLFAIARQESAFAADARSSAGAMGLMQLMPATAKQTAHRYGVNYQYWDLIKPEQNIALGSHYLEELLTEFNGNRVLAAAAYNAGPYRVKQWLKQTDEQLPHDIWIETIPFHETRGYVQNVMAFSVIYGYRLGQQAAMLSENELRPPRLSLSK